MNRDALPPPPEDGADEEDAVRALLPFFVNGSLDRAGRERVHLWLQRSELHVHELRWHTSLAAGVRTEAAVARDDAGLAHLRARLRAEREAKAPTRSGPSWSEQLSAWLRAFAPQAPRLAYAVVAVQALALGLLLAQPTREDELIRGGSVVAPMAAGPYARVLFRPGSDEKALRGFLLAQRLQIVAGPNAIGEYWLARVPPDDPSAASWIDAVRRAEIVAEVVADDRPPSLRD